MDNELAQHLKTLKILEIYENKDWKLAGYSSCCHEDLFRCLLFFLILNSKKFFPRCSDLIKEVKKSEIIDGINDYSRRCQSEMQFVENADLIRHRGANGKQ